jgi:hypothetical protein
MTLEELKTEIGSVMYQYWQELPEPKPTQTKFLYGPYSLLNDVDRWIEDQEDAKAYPGLYDWKI